MIKVLDFVKFDKPPVIGFLDIKVTYSSEKWEIFRNLPVCQNKGKHWISFGNVKRGEKWMPKYERAPFPSNFFAECLKAFKEYVSNSDTDANLFEAN